MAKRTYYAATHYYGINIANDYATLYRFDNATSRDEFVSIDESKRETLTRNEARRHFPNAFRMVGEFHDESDERDWISHDGGAWSYWRDSNIYYK